MRRALGGHYHRAMHVGELLYLDNAATSFPKPERVHSAMERYSRGLGAPARGTHGPAVEAARLVDVCRARLLELVGASGWNPGQVIFTLNCSDALNLAIKGLIFHRLRTEPGRPVHLITSTLDHNSILRPFNALEGEWIRGVQITQTKVEPDAETGLLDASEIETAMTPDTLMVATLHASNVTGALQPVEAIGAVCRRRGVMFVLDAAQSLGHAALDVLAAKVDLLAFAGHKGVLGPTGTGGLIIRPGVERVLDPLREGGTGSRVERDTQPTDLPDKYEPGSHNTLGIVGLSEGVAWLLERGIASLREHEAALTGLLLRGVAEVPGVRVLGSLDPSLRVGVVSFTHETVGPLVIARELEARYGILSRAGLHCAPLAHRGLGTTGDASRLGAARLSIGPLVSERDVERAVEAVRGVCAGVAAVR